MRVALVAMAVALGACSTASLHVFGPSRESLSRDDLRHIAALAAQYPNYGTLRRVEALSPDKVRLEFRYEIVVTGGGMFISSRRYFRFDAIKKNGEWCPVKNRSGEIKLEKTPWEGKTWTAPT